jgi:hypothetical protein
MSLRLSRRALLRRALVGGTALGMGHRSLAASDRRAGAPLSENKRDATVRASQVEPLIRLLEETPRDQVLEAVGEKILEGAGYLDVLAALLLAGVREVQPRPTVGYKFHTVLAVISYHLIGNGLSERDRWLPVFWGIDYLKVAQASDAAEGDWKLDPVDEAAMPSAEKTGLALVEAMHRWDEPAADVSAAAVARRLKPDSAFELFYPLGARDFRSIGHKAIFVMCAQRTLRLIGWEHAEPVLRSLAYALLMHEGGNPADRDDLADRPWRRNEKIVGRIRGDWADGQPNSEATTELLAVLRSGSYEDATDAVIERLNHGTSPSSIWDAVFCGAAELQLRLPNIVSLHAVTTTRAIHHAFRTTGQDETRRLLLLQNAAMLPMFRDAAKQRGRLQDAPIDELEPIAPKVSDEAAIKEIFEDLGEQRRTAAQKILGYLQSRRPARLLVEGIRRLVALKGDGAHDFKFTSAALESFQHVSEAWRGRYLACGAMHFVGPDQRDNAVVARTREALDR